MMTLTVFLQNTLLTLLSITVIHTIMKIFHDSYYQQSEKVQSFQYQKTVQIIKFQIIIALAHDSRGTFL